MVLRRLALTLSACLVLPAAGPATSADTPRATAATAQIVAAPPPDAAAVFSPHARRMVQAYLRLRMLELREADLTRVRAVIEHRLPVDALLDDPSASPPAKPVVR